MPLAPDPTWGGGWREREREGGGGSGEEREGGRREEGAKEREREGGSGRGERGGGPSSCSDYNACKMHATGMQVGAILASASFRPPLHITSHAVSLIAVFLCRLNGTRSVL